MKKYLTLAAIAAFTLASCAKVETSVPTAEKNAIGFSIYSPRALNRADVANYADSSILISGAEFDVYGWSTKNAVSFNGSNGTQFMNWYTVTYQNDGNTDGTKNLYPDGYRYWPSGDDPDYLHFYAYYPSNAGTITAPAGLGVFSFTAEDAAADQVDFMVADLVKDQTYENTNSGVDGTVNLTFRHMLTRVQFKFKTTADVIKNNTTVTLTDVKLHGIKTSGELTSAYDGSAFSTSWGNQADTASYEVFVNGADINNFVLDSLAAPATNAKSDIFLMVPQAMIDKAAASADPQFIEVHWDVEYSDGVITHNSKKLYFKNDLKTTDNITAPAAALDLDWAKNASITYTLTIGPKPILFTAEVADWAAETYGYFNVN